MKILFLLLPFGIIIAQTGAINGRLIDQSGGTVRDVAVYYKAYPVSRIVYSDSAGKFSLPAEHLGDHVIRFERFGWLPKERRLIVSSSMVDLGMITITFGDADASGTVDLKDLSTFEDVYLDSVTNSNRFMDYNNEGVIDSTCINLTAMGVESIGPLPNEWIVSKPDYVSFIPEQSNPEFATNQHYLMTKLKNGRWFGIWTSGYQEGAPNQSMLCHWSDDEGKSWSPYIVIDGPTADGRIASWGFPIYVPELDRIYVFYNKDSGSRIYHQGEMYMKFSSNNGEDWSDVFRYKFEPGEYTPKDTTILPQWWVYQKPVKIGNKFLVGFTEVLPHEPDIFFATEVRFFSFENILTENDPQKLEIKTYPEKGKPGLRGSYFGGTNRSTMQEPSIVQLSDGRLMCVMRASIGSPYYSVSQDSGKTWTEPMILLTREYGKPLKQPLASCPVYSIGNGRFVMIYHNNSGDANGGAHAGDGSKNRTPAFLIFGNESKSEFDQPVSFSEPIRFLENYVRPFGPQNRTEMATYPSLMEHNGKYILWYPDRKYYLLGKNIPQPLK